MEISLLQVLFEKDYKRKPSSDLQLISKKAWAWLTKKPISDKDKKNQGKSQHKANLIENHLKKPFERMKDMSPYFFRFGEKNLDSIFNAQTLRPFLMELLRDHNYEYGNKFRNDIISVELGRMLSELGLELLRDVTTKTSIHEHIDSVLQDYYEHMEYLKKPIKELKKELYKSQRKKKKSESDKKRIKKLEAKIKNKLDSLLPYYCELNYSKDFEHDMSKKYHLKLESDTILHPYDKRYPEAPSRVPPKLYQLINREVNSKTERLEKIIRQEFELDREKIRKLRFTQITGKVLTEAEWSQ